jgi:hypothetical protein
VIVTPVVERTYAPGETGVVTVPLKVVAAVEAVLELRRAELAGGHDLDDDLRVRGRRRPGERESSGSCCDAARAGAAGDDDAEPLQRAEQRGPPLVHRLGGQQLRERERHESPGLENCEAHRGDGEHEVERTELVAGPGEVNRQGRGSCVEGDVGVGRLDRFFAQRLALDVTLDLRSGRS